MDRRTRRPGGIDVDIPVGARGCAAAGGDGIARARQRPRHAVAGRSHGLQHQIGHDVEAFQPPARCAWRYGRAPVKTMSMALSAKGNANPLKAISVARPTMAYLRSIRSVVSTAMSGPIGLTSAISVP